MRKSFVLVTGIALYIALCALPSTAAAANENNCVVTNSNFTTFSGTKWMSVNCSSGTVYNSYVNNVTTACNMDIDTIKLWSSIALSARMSGMHLTVWYTTLSCNGTSQNIITALEMKDS